MDKKEEPRVQKKVLGRGLGALIADVAGPRTSLMHCPIESIRPSRTQPRKKFESDSLSQLADSIRENGIIEPLIVRKDSGGFELIAGERRLRAAGVAGLKEVPVIIMEATDRECLEFAIIENIQREDLNPIEEAEAFQSLIGFGLSQEEVAKKVGKDRATVANYMRLLKLPPEVKDELIKETISMGHARALLSMEGHAAQRELCKKVIAKGLSVRETEKLANRWLKKDVLPGKRVLRLSFVEDDLRRIFGTKVSVKERNGKGRIEIEFYSPEERERIIELLKSI